jgi:DNA-binding MarR family transcriptional regulator
MLNFLNDSGRATVGQIAVQIGVSSQFITLEANKLVGRGLVAKRNNEADRRSVFLELTQIGKSLMLALAPLQREVNDLMFRSLTSEHVTDLRSILAALIKDGRSALHQQEFARWRDQSTPSLQIREFRSLFAGRAIENRRRRKD